MLASRYSYGLKAGGAHGSKAGRRKACGKAE